MDRSRLPARQRNPLAHLSLDRRQYLVNLQYTRPPHELFYAAQHPHHPLVDIGPDFASTWMVSLQEILELSPPDLSVAHRIDLATPPFYPVWMCWAQGKQVLVYTPGELSRQPKGAAPTPLGPWPAGYGDPWPWPWEQGKGVYAPLPKSPGGDSPPWGDGTVYATRALTYPKGEWGRTPWELFQLRGRAEDTQLLDAGDVVVCRQYPRDATLYTPTNRWFIDENGRDFYAQCYEQGDVRALGLELPAPAGETWGLPCDPQPTPKATRKYYPDDEVFKKEYLRVYAEQTALQGSSVSLPTVGRNMMPPLKERTLRRYLKAIRIHHPPQ